MSKISENQCTRVALRKESVDRNSCPLFFSCWLLASLSARRAWIEIPAGCWRDARRAVALRKESVDRNFGGAFGKLSALVALRKESVDRNPNSIRRCLMSVGRSPQGERG